MPLLIFGLKVFNAVLKFLPKLDWADKIPLVTATATVSDIFAWANYFLPIPLFLVLLTLTGGFYAFKLILRVLWAVRDFIK